MKRFLVAGVLATLLSTTAVAEDPYELAKQRFDESDTVSELIAQLNAEGYASLNDSYVNPVAHIVFPDESGAIGPDDGDFRFIAIQTFRRTVDGGGYKTVSIVGHVHVPEDAEASVLAEIVEY